MESRLSEAVVEAGLVSWWPAPPQPWRACLVYLFFSFCALLCSGAVTGEIGRASRSFGWELVCIVFPPPSACQKNWCAFLCLSRYDCISPGEMQKLAFARLFYHRPTFASKQSSCWSKTGSVSEPTLYFHVSSLFIASSTGWGNVSHEWRGWALLLQFLATDGSDLSQYWPSLVNCTGIHFIQ